MLPAHFAAPDRIREMRDLEAIRSGLALGRVTRRDVLRLVDEVERLRGVAANAEQDRLLAAAAMAESSIRTRLADLSTEHMATELRRRGWSVAQREVTRHAA